MATSSVLSGVVAFQIPATTDDTSVSPQAKSAKGTELNRTAIAIRCSQASRPRGRASRRSTRIASSAIAPSTQRRNATCSGSNARSPTLMKRKLAPQMALRTTNSGSQSRLVSVLAAIPYP